MELYRIAIDWGKRKRFACGCLERVHHTQGVPCVACGEEQYTPDYNHLFENKGWDTKMFLDSGYYADFINSQIKVVVSEKAKKMLTENFGNAVDFGDIEMVSFRDLTTEKAKEIRDYSGSAALKKIPDDPPQYFRLLLKQGADLDFQRTNIELAVDCPKCGLKRYQTPGLTYVGENMPHIIESTWKGCDIFYVEGLGNRMFCTERFVGIYNQNELTGLEFEQVEVV